MPEITGVICEFLIMIAMLVAVWFFGKREGVNGEKKKQADRRADSVSRGLSAGSDASDRWLQKHGR
ncbi:MAG: hypothetical protein J6S85_03965 [Methanobrevibacter sp.]|nr:hypothetical protein [Methanobrevibacter sp.]MBO7712699.1 hypothetical protein [Methanobrevibacter sp.]